MGVTGVREQTSKLAPELVARVRSVTDLPVGVGLGVRDRQQAAQVAAYADGVIVGTALVRCLVDAPDHAAGLSALRTLTSDLAAGVRDRR
jgi:tryptophan synthase alpha chain